jgi:hypothetical protein
MIKNRSRFSYRMNLLNAGAFRWDIGREGRDRLAYGVEILPVLFLEPIDGAGSRGSDRTLLAISTSF